MTLFLKIFLLLFALSFTLYADEISSQSKSSYDVKVWGERIATFRVPFRELTPKERVEMAQERILEIHTGLDHYSVKAIPAQEGNISGAWITVNGRNIFGLLNEDNDPNNNETFEQFTQKTTLNLTKWLQQREQQQSWPLILKGIGFSFLATFLFALLFTLLLRYSHKISNRLESTSDDAIHPSFEIAGINIRPYLTTLGIGILKIVVWGLGLPLVYAWMTFIFRQFPYTASWGSGLTDFIFTLLSGFLEGTLSALPGLMAVAVIFFITRLIIRVFDTFFNSIENGSLDVVWMEPETARASRRVVVVLIWIFALVVAYPYIPGSQTEAFKGITVFLGLMLSLGSAGIVGQVLGGIVVVYTRAFQTGDFVKINEYEGKIEEIGVLSTKIKTLRNEEITIPNAVLLSATTTNYSRYAKKGEGAIVATTVTIGYDAPWRQVHAMLEIAASRTSTILKNPEPLTLQKALSDFYVEYTLRFAIEKPESRYRVLSELHGHIQDVFNEYGVQILSPNFEAQPEGGAVWVPKEKWYEAPAIKKEN